MIRWIFFFEEGNVKTDITTEQEDARIEEFVRENPKGILHLPSKDTDIYVNMERVKCFCRAIVDEDAEKKARQDAIDAQLGLDATT